LYITIIYRKRKYMPSRKNRLTSQVAASAMMSVITTPFLLAVLVE